MTEKKPRVEVTKIFDGIRRTMLEHYKTIYAKEQAQHSGTRGTLYENLLQDFLRDYLPQRFYIGSGQVISSHTVADADGHPQNLSRQMDIVIFDNFNHPVLLPKYELFPIEGTLAVIEVKSNLDDKNELLGAFANIESAKRLSSSETFAPKSDPTKNDLSNITPPLGIIFAFASQRPKTVAKHWQNWNDSKEIRYRTDMICLLKEEVLMVDTNRFKRFFDPHQAITLDPLGSAGKNKIVAIKTASMLFFFVKLLLQDLREMNTFSERLTATTYSSYARRIRYSQLFCIDNALNFPTDPTNWSSEF